MPPRTFIVDRFEIDSEDVLGAGGFGQVFRAIDQASGETVAAKVIDSKRMRRDKILHEIRLMERVSNHEGVVGLRGAQEVVEESKIFIFMELATGGELFGRVVKNGKLEEPEAVRYFVEVVSAVGYLHEQGVVHRDLKLENVLLSSSDTCKLCDFGLAHLFERGPGGEMLVQTLKEVCGSKSYAAPEVLAGMGYDGLRADMWSLGICLFAMLAGFFPLDEASGADWRYERVKMAAASGQSTCHTIYGFYERPCEHSAEAVHLIDSMLATDPARRLDVAAVLASPWLTGNTIGEEEAVVYRGLSANADPSKLMALLAEGSDELRGPVYRGGAGGGGGGGGMGPPPMLCKQEAMFCEDFHIADA